MTDLTPENNYQFPPTPAAAVLGRDAWNYVFGSISGRLGGLETQRTDLDDLMADLSFTAQARVDAAVTPLIEAVEYRINGMTGQLDELQETVNSILAGGIPAENVTESAERRFWTPADQVALEDKADAEAVITALGLKENKSAKGVPDGYAPLNADGKVPMSFIPVATEVTFEVVSVSGTFTKQPNDIAYMVECIGAGGGGSSNTANSRGGGGGGASVSVMLASSAVGATEAIIVGAGGAGGDPGGHGGQTAFGSLVSAPGGRGGISNLGGMNGLGVAATATAGTVNDAYAGGAGGAGALAGASFHGGGGGGGGNAGPTLLGGLSIRAGKGGDAGQPGTAPGGGGGASTATPGSGARGEVRIWRFKK